MATYTGTITINGKSHEVCVENGLRYIDGMTVEEFAAKLDRRTLEELAVVGQRALVDEKKGTKNGGYQKMMDRAHIVKNN